MIEVIQQLEPKSRVNRRCDISNFFHDTCFPMDKMTFAEKRMLVEYRNRPWKEKILKGEVYVRQTNKYEGDIYTFKAHAGLFHIFCKYELWPEY